MNNKQNEPDVILTIKASWINVILAGLDEVPHKYSRPVFDSVSKQAHDQLNQSVPKGSLQDRVL
jgi:phage terminase large subunit-like protein